MWFCNAHPFNYIYLFIFQTRMTINQSALLILLLLYICSFVCSGNKNNRQFISVNSSLDLELYLCNTTWSSEYLVFLLNSSVDFSISSGNSVKWLFRVMR